MMAIATYLRHVREELAHVTWPTPREAVGHTLVIILISIVVAAMVGVLDYALGEFVSAIVGG